MTIMKHSKRPLVSAVILLLEVGIAWISFRMGYIAENANNDWSEYWGWAIVASLVLAVVLISRIWPATIEAFALESAAAKMAKSAMGFGVERFYNMSIAADKDERNRDTQTEIQKSHEMRLCANSGASYLDPAVSRHGRYIRERLRSGISFKIVLLHPRSSEKRLRNELNHGNEELDHKVNMENLIRMCAEFPNLEVKLVSRGMHGTIFCTNDCAFFDPYHLAVVDSRIENLSYCLRVRDTNPPKIEGYLKLLRGHFETLWAEGEPLRAWYDKELSEQKKLPPWPMKTP